MKKLLLSLALMLGAAVGGAQIPYSASLSEYTMLLSGAPSIAYGTVTSVGITAPSEINVTGSPVTGSGNIALAWAAQVKNKFFVGPTSGADATPTFRLIVPSDFGTYTSGTMVPTTTDGTTFTLAASGGGGNITLYENFRAQDGQFLSATFPALQKNGTNIPVMSLMYDAAADEGAFWVTEVPRYVSGNITLRILFYADTATSGNVVWGGALAAITPDADADIEAKALATETTATCAASGTAQRLTTCSITLSNLDSVAAGDLLYLRVRRLGSNGSDTMTGDAGLVSARISYLATP